MPPVATTWATEQEVTVVETMHHRLADQAWLPTVHGVDGAEVSREGLVGNPQALQVPLPGPMRQAPSWPAHAPQAFEASQFLMDGAPEVVRCPQGTPSRSWPPTPDARGQPMLPGFWHTQDGAGCAVRSRCPRSTTGPRAWT